MPHSQDTQTLWRNGTPVSRRFDDPYFSLENGLDEARHVSLNGNGLPDRFRPGFRIAELGIGTGLNLLAALETWQHAGIAGPLRYTGFEAFPMDAASMAQALAAFPDLTELAPPLVAAWERGDTELRTPLLQAEFILGDARRTLPEWSGQADAWFLDGFAPARNPELWEPELLQEVARRTAPGGSAATYSAAGHVRRALAAAGYVVERRPGFGRKRHMTVARLP